LTRLTLLERETIIRWSGDPGDCLYVATHDEKLAQGLIAAGATIRHQSERGGVRYWKLEAPREWIRWPKPPTRRKVSEATLRALQEGRRKASSRLQNDVTNVVTGVGQPASAISPSQPQDAASEPVS